MIYSKFYLQNKTKIPTLVGFLSITFITLLLLRFFSVRPKPSSALKKSITRLEITNISASSATIFWQSEEKETGWLIYGSSPKQMNQLAFDERDIISKKNSYLTHYISIKGLEAGKKYFFAIVSDNKIITNLNNIPFNFTTLSHSPKTRGLNPAYGRIIKANNTPLEAAVVLLSTEGKVFASTLTKSTGEWLIPLNDKNLTSSSKIKIEVISEDNQTSTVTTNLNKISPLPQTIIIGKNYDFTQEDNILSATSSNSTIKEIDKVEIIYPKEKAIIPGRLPLIKGVAAPKTTVYIVIKSPKIYSARVITDDKGFWSFSPPEALSLGEHTVTVLAKDKEGKDVFIERKFYIIGNEGANVSVLGEATPSATITPYQPLPTPTIPAITISATPSPPTSGISFFLPVVAGLSFFILGLGVILAF